MIILLRLLPGIPLIFIAYLIAVKFSNQRNIHIDEARGINHIRSDDKTLKRKLTILDNKLYSKVRTNDKVKNLYDRQMTWLIKKGNPFHLNIVTYYLLKIPGILIGMLSLKSNLTITFRLVLLAVGILVFFYVEIKYIEINKEDSLQIKKDIVKVYNQLDVMSYANIDIYKALLEVGSVIKNERFKKDYINCTSSIIKTKNIPESLSNLAEKYDLNEIDSFVTTITQGIETGRIREMLEGQRKILNKRYLGYKDTETENKKSKVTLGIMLMAISVMGIVLYSFFTLIMDKLSVLF